MQTLRGAVTTPQKGIQIMLNLLDNISKTTRKVWSDNEKAIGSKYGFYRFRICVNGIGEVHLTDLQNMTDIAKGNRAVQQKIRELARGNA